LMIRPARRALIEGTTASIIEKVPARLVGIVRSARSSACSPAGVGKNTPAQLTFHHELRAGQLILVRSWLAPESL